jgi:hypothetical protein
MPAGPKNIPTSSPAVAPATAHFEAPLTLAPSAEASQSTAQMAAASRPATTRVGQPTRVNPSAQATSTAPPKRSSEPGSTGRTTPARPASRASAPRAYRRIVIGLL